MKDPRMTQIYAENVAPFRLAFCCFEICEYLRHLRLKPYVGLTNND